jgi:hypothetical protein
LLLAANILFFRAYEGPGNGRGDWLRPGPLAMLSSAPASTSANASHQPLERLANGWLIHCGLATVLEEAGAEDNDEAQAIAIQLGITVDLDLTAIAHLVGPLVW